MRVAYITAGAAGMYCGSCMHDNTLARALIRKGVDVTLIPTYTPIRTDEVDVTVERVFYGGINVFLQQKSAFFRHTPWFLDKLLNHRALLKWVSRFSSSTKAEDLGALTISVLKGEHGNQRKELKKLVAWLRDEVQPDLVQITNSMFAGFAHMIKQELGTPVLCSLQGEDLFLDAMIQPYKDQARDLLRERCRELDGFVVNSQYYRDFMSDYLEVAPDRIHIAPLGLSLSGHGETPPEREETPFVIGYLARVCPEKGVDILIEAFRLLCAELGKEHFKLRIAGYLSPGDQAFYDKLRQKTQEWGLTDHISFEGEVDREDKIKFLNEIDVFSVPAPYKEPKGLYVLEALANGAPVIQPNHGAFPELVVGTSGGILVEPNSPRALAEALKKVFHDRDLLRTMGTEGKASVFSNYSDTVMAEKMLEIYQTYVTVSAEDRR